MGWMHSTPKVKPPPAQQSKAAPPPPEEKPQTRAEKIMAAGGEPLMPEVGEVAYMVAYWQDVGIVTTGGMAPAKLQSSEILAWAQGNGIVLAPWEFATLRDMSGAYLAQLSAGDDPEALPPYGDPVQEFDRDEMAKRIKSQMKVFSLKKR